MENKYSYKTSKRFIEPNTLIVKRIRRKYQSSILGKQETKEL
jgi:hypothetical protein